MGEKKSRTVTKERGYFERTKIRYGKKRKQKTEYVDTSKKKVVLAKVGDLEFYVYPYDYPDTVFAGIYPMSTKLDKGDVNKFLGVLNKLRWYFNNEWENEPTRSKGANYRRRAIEQAYNLGLNDLKKRKKS